VRFTPPYTIAAAEVDEAAKTLADALEEMAP
jgi:acetylornithine/succinyldiaminopimelate/putrescine aminotransferase